ncbi:MAG TPA: GNAT family N-acetyltransferase [Amycolatopsis sp.]|nr:GNAT family N-acetyltransferase [Amycolatopsis sp.]
MLRPTYPIKTARLLLRPFTAGDLSAFHAIHAHADVARYLSWRPGNRAESAEVLATKSGQTTLTEAGQTLSLAVELIEKRDLVGDLTLVWEAEEHGAGEIVAVFHPRHQGRGYAAEALTEILRLAFDEVGMNKIYGHCDHRNIASASLMEALGMRREPPRRDGELTYAMSAAEWKRS